MHTVISDYDGTIYANGRLLGDVVPAITAWRNNGNRFGIATGRDYSMILPEITRWAIPVDFLICINGAAVYDADMTLLRSHLLDDPLIPVILRHPAGLASLHYQFSGLDPLRVFLRPGSLFWDAGIAFEKVPDMEQALATRRIGQISLAYKTEAESEKWTKALNDELGDRIAAHRNKRMIDVTGKGVDKAAGIAALLECKGWPEIGIHTVGDGTNDINMLRAYDGYAVSGASEDVVAIVNKQCADVPELLTALS